jgi:tetratricopeptide (TPR) repeat protein
MHLKAGRTEEALEKLKKTAKINPLAEGAYRTLGDIMIRQDNLSGAASYYIRTLRVDPGNEAAANNLRYLAGRQRNPETSEKLNSLFSEAAGYIEKKDWKEALRVTDEITAIDPANMQALLYAGNIHYQMGNYQKAEDYYRIILAIEPGHTTARSNLEAIKKNQ